MMQDTTAISGSWTVHCDPASPTARDYAGQRYYYCPTCGRMVYQPGRELCEGCGQRLDWSWWRWHCNDD